MKHILTILSLIITINSTGQNNFTIKDHSIQWQKVFNDEVDIIDLIKHLKTVTGLTNITDIDNQISTTIDNDNVNYKNYGGKTMTTLIALNHQLFASAIIDIKPNRYRVTVNNIYFIDDWSETTIKLSEISLKKSGHLKTSKTITNGLDYLNQHFTERFTYHKPTDW